MPMKVYKYVIPQIVEPLTHIVNLSMKNGVMPAACKIASITPILKSGDPNDPKKFRPISILPLLGKLETILRTNNLQLMWRKTNS